MPLAHMPHNLTYRTAQHLVAPRYTLDASQHRCGCCVACPPPQHFRGEGAAELASAPAPPLLAKKPRAPETQAFLLFMHDEANKAKYGALSVAQKAKAACADWKLYSDAQKQVYRDKAKAKATEAAQQRRVPAAGKCT